MPGINLILFMAPCLINVSVLEHRLSSHPEQIFVKNFCGGLKDGFDIDSFGPQKCKIPPNFSSANEKFDF